MEDTRSRFLSVRLTESQKQDLRLVARVEGISPSEMIRRAIQERKELVACGRTNMRRNRAHPDQHEGVS
jgi:hypothetical protein